MSLVVGLKNSVFFILNEIKKEIIFLVFVDKCIELCSVLCILIVECLLACYVKLGEYIWCIIYCNGCDILV